MFLRAKPTCRYLTLNFRRLPDSGLLAKNLYWPSSSHKTQDTFLSDPDHCPSATTSWCEDHFASNPAFCTAPQHQDSACSIRTNNGVTSVRSHAFTPTFREIPLVHQMHRGLFCYCSWKNLGFCLHLLQGGGTKRERHGLRSSSLCTLFLCVSAILFPGGAEDWTQGLSYIPAPNHSVFKTCSK